MSQAGLVLVPIQLGYIPEHFRHSSGVFLGLDHRTILVVAVRREVASPARFAMLARTTLEAVAGFVTITAKVQVARTLSGSGGVSLTPAFPAWRVLGLTTETDLSFVPT